MKTIFFSTLLAAMATVSHAALIVSYVDGSSTSKSPSGAGAQITATDLTNIGGAAINMNGAPGSVALPDLEAGNIWLNSAANGYNSTNGNAGGRGIRFTLTMDEPTTFTELKLSLEHMIVNTTASATGTTVFGYEVFLYAGDIKASPATGSSGDFISIYKENTTALGLEAKTYGGASAPVIDLVGLLGADKLSDVRQLTFVLAPLNTYQASGSIYHAFGNIKLEGSVASSIPESSTAVLILPALSLLALRRRSLNN